MKEPSKDESKIKIKAEFNLCDEYPTKKQNFEKLCTMLEKQGYTVEKEIKEFMGGNEKNEISLIKNDKEIKIFTCADPYATDAIMDSNLGFRFNDVIKKIETLNKQ